MLIWFDNVLIQVVEMRVILPSEPLNVEISERNLSFTSPKILGGSNIQCYEVKCHNYFILMFDLKTCQVHLRPTNSHDWGLFREIKTKHLSSEPDIEEKIFASLVGSFDLRVCARNLAGCGVCSNKMSAIFPGSWGLYKKNKMFPNWCFGSSMKLQKSQGI